MKSLTDCFLYGILDSGYCALESMPAMAAKMIEGGVDIVQLRAKNLPVPRVRELALLMAPQFEEAHIPWVINDYPEIAREIGADYFHVGQEDKPLAEARSIAGRGVKAGKSTHSVQQAIAAEAEGADYIGFGPLFATPTKPDYTPIGTAEIEEVHLKVKIPIFCIGGIKRENLESILKAGARRVVVVSGILQAADVVSYCRDLKAQLYQRIASSKT